MAKRRAPRTYLYQPRNSRNWWLKLQLYGEAATRAGWALKRFSLGTDSRSEAEIRAFPHLAEFKAFKQAVARGEREVPPPMPTERTLFPLHEGVALKMAEPAAANIRLEPAVLVPEHVWVEPKAKLDDTALIAMWREAKNGKPHVEEDLTRTLAFFREHVSKKPLTQCTREDGKKLVRLLFAKPKGNAYATVDKSAGLLRAMCYVADIDPNPFSRIMPGKPTAPSIAKPPRAYMSDDKMVLLASKLGELRPTDQLLWRLLACTGLRIEEAFQIVEEETEDGVRFARVGTKTQSSYRKLVFPTVLLPHLPERITGPLLPGKPDKEGKRSPPAEKRLMRWLRKHGIAYDTKKNTGDPRFVLHSLRHRASNVCERLDVAEKDLNFLLGHQKTVGRRYGDHPATKLLRVVDAIAAVTPLGLD